MLIKCPECGNSVSDKAKVCVHCGYPIEQYVITSIQVENVEPQKKTDFSWFKNAHVGDSFKFGLFPQSKIEKDDLFVHEAGAYVNDNVNGVFCTERDVADVRGAGDVFYRINYLGQQGTYKMEPIDWEVIDEKDNAILALSTKLLKRIRFGGLPNALYDNSDVRKYLKNVFYDFAFIESEQKMLMPALVMDEDSLPVPSTLINQFKAGACDTVFLPSLSELSRAHNFTIVKERTDYAIGSARKGGYSNWWLTRSVVEPDEYGRRIGMIVQSTDGKKLTTAQKGEQDELAGVAPAIWVRRNPI